MGLMKTLVLPPNKAITITLLISVFSAIVPRSFSQEKLSSTDSEEVSEQLAAYERRIAEIESQSGTYAPELIEVYSELVAILEHSEQWVQLSEVIQRQLQINRTTYGFEDLRLIPILNKLVTSDIKLGRVNEVSAHLEHIRFVIGSNDGTTTDHLLQAIAQQADWHLALVHYSNPEHRVENFFKARGLTEELLEISEERYQENDPKLIPWLYRDSVNKYQLVKFVSGSNSVGYDGLDRLIREDGLGKLGHRSLYTPHFTTRVTPGRREIPTTEENATFGHYYLRQAFLNVDQIYDIAVSEENIEMQAMALLYRADFKRLAGLASANRDIRDAQELLLQAGVSRLEIEDFFSRPIVIPNPKLHLSFAEAYKEIQAMDSEVRSLYPDALQETDIIVGHFTAWNHMLESSQMPLQKDQLLEAPSEFSEVLVKLSINSSGDTYSRESILRQPDETSVGIFAVRGISKITFRPRFENGKARRTPNVYMSYRYIPRP